MSCRDGVEKVRYRDLFTLPSGEVLENLHPSEPKQQCLVWSENHSTTTLLSRIVKASFLLTNREHGH